MLVTLVEATHVLMITMMAPSPNLGLTLSIAQLKSHTARMSRTHCSSTVPKRVAHAQTALTALTVPVLIATMAIAIPQAAQQSASPRRDVGIVRFGWQGRRQPVSSSQWTLKDSKIVLVFINYLHLHNSR